jgi:acetyl esterase/lipase
MVPKGYAVASINYRLSQHAIFPAQIEDCKAAVRWLRAHAAKYQMDPKHVAAWGFSAGGHLVALLGATGGVKTFDQSGGNLDQSSRVQAVIDMAGPIDFIASGKQADEPGGMSQLIGGPVSKNPDKARKASPLSYVSRDAAPFLIFHGDKDRAVSPSQSKALAKALEDAGVEVTLRVVKGGEHTNPSCLSPQDRKLAEDFLARHLAKP